ncbi:MAG: type III-B CRISPR-associated protein Cas10/Cmr2 [Firmicutes bacterium]|nr:type III-B CRISPR-associated protein Cas10/Cmr2 [Bacillota bacterium]
MTEMRNFHFSLGPVQEFVGKARRLRDYWTGSYVLSYLTEQAMKEIDENGGQLIFPPYKNGNLPNSHNNLPIGHYPNRFQAKIPVDFEPTRCKKRLNAAWQKIADFVWQEYIEEIAPLGKGTKEIWDRQVENFWYVQWVVTNEEDESLLDKRKNWRSHIPGVELGDKCTLFGNLQEISGYSRSSRKGESKKQKDFWEKLHLKLAALDLKEGERLCAVALIKRVFPRAYNILEGTNLPLNFPSTTYMSAIPWLKNVIKKADKQALDFAKVAKKLKGAGSEYHAGIKSLDRATKKDFQLRNFLSLDGNFFYDHTLLNDNLWEKNTCTIREKLTAKLKAINKKTFEADTYYALLSMDGDNMGAILHEHSCVKEKISQAISDFSKSVPAVIEKNDGRTIYAGGEDVFAILPVNTAIDAAVELSKKYTALLAPIIDSEKKATISAAIIFAHHHTPLTQVYDEIQSLLDKVAKEKYGRSTLAISTWNTGGKDLVWAMPWQKFLTVEEHENLFKELSSAMGQSDERNNPASQQREGFISHSFIYNIRRELSLFLEEGSAFPEGKFLDLLTAEYVRSMSKKGRTLSNKEVLPLMKKLLEVCSIYYRNKEGTLIKQKGFNIDGALLVKFLTGRWKHGCQDMAV